MRGSAFVVGVGAVAILVLGFTLNRSEPQAPIPLPTTRLPGPVNIAVPETGGPCDPPAGGIPLKPRPVPDVRGVPLCEAIRLVESSGWAVVLYERSTPTRGIGSDDLIGTQTPSPGTRHPNGGAVRLEVLRQPIQPHATVGLDCRPENTQLVKASRLPSGLIDENRVPRWVPVANARQPYGFVGCTPREFVNPEIDQGRAIKELLGTSTPGPPYPVFSTDGILIGYAVSAAGFQPLNVVVQDHLVPPDVIARTPSYDEYKASG